MREKLYFYECDQKREQCKNSVVCGTLCKFTSDISHAVSKEPISDETYVKYMREANLDMFGKQLKEEEA